MATTGIDNLKQELRRQGHSATISKVSELINQSNLDSSTRLLLSQEPIYVILLRKIILDLRITDDKGIYFRLLSEVEPYRRDLYKNLLVDILRAHNVETPSNSEVDNLVQRLIELNPDVDKVAPVILNEFRKQKLEGGLPLLVDAYLKNFPDVYFDRNQRPAIAQAMINRLTEAGIGVLFSQVDTQLKLDTQLNKYNDELFYAYSQALRSVGDGSDPIKSIFNSDGISNWDYTVDYFDTVEGQGVVRENIKAAGALHYIQTLGDQMGVFHIGDAIILSWSQGNLDILQGQTTQKLYRYFKLRDQRTTREERAMFYRQVLNAGNAQTLENMVVNEDFPVLWETLLTTAKDYYDAFQSKDYNPRVVSKQSVFQAIRELQHNLSVNCSGMVKAIIPELYAHLQSCFEIIDQKEVADQLGNGVDKTRWKVIENVHKSLTNQKPPVLAYLTIAVEGNKIFRFIADFNASAVTNEVFDEFIQSTERYRVASQQLQAPTRKGLLPGMPAVPKETKKEQLQKIDDWDF